MQPRTGTSLGRRTLGRRLRRALPPLTAGVLAAGTLLLGPGSARAWAEAPSQAGWWSSANPGGVAGPATAPAPPDVPAGGLLVEGGMGSAPGGGDAGPTAFGAVVYLVSSGQRPVTLTLDVAPGSGTTPAATLELCPLASRAINAEDGGPMSDAPRFSCSTNVTAAPSSAGDSYSFDVSKLAGPGTLAVAVLPTAPTDRIVLARPAASSLSLGPSGGAPAPAPAPAGSDGGSAPAGSAAPSDGSASAAPAAADPSPAAALPDPAASLTSPVPGASLPAASAAPVPQAAGSSTPAASTSSAGPAPAPAPPAGTGGARPGAVAALVLAFLIGGAIWLGAGRAAARAAAGEAGR